MASIKGIRARRESCLLMGCGGLVMLSGFWIMYSSSYVRERAMKELTQFCDKFGITTNNPEQHDTFTHACRLQIKYVKKIKRLPVVFTRGETATIINQLSGTLRLVVSLL